MVLLIKQCGHVYMHVIFIITFLFVCLLFGCFLVKNLFFFRIYNCVCKFDENKNKNLLKKKFQSKKINFNLVNSSFKTSVIIITFCFHQFLIAIISLTSSNVIFSLPFLSVMLYFLYDDQNNDYSSI